MTSDTSGGDSSGGNTSGSHHEAAFGQQMTQVARWVRGRGTRGRLLARRTLRRLGPKLALGVVLLSGLLGQLAAAGIGTVPVAHAAASSQGGKNTFHASNDHGGKAVYLPGQVKTVKTLPPRDASFRPAPVSMKPADMVLSPTAAAHLLGSDRRLEVTVPQGAVTSALLTKVGGALHLHVEELEGPSGGTDSGHVSLGTYDFTLMNAAGKKVAASLARPITLTLHLDGWRGAAFDLSHVTLMINVGVPLSVFAGPDGTVPTKVTPSYVPATLDQSAKTLTAQMPLTGSGGGSSTGTWNTESPEAQWSKQADTSVDLSGGNLTYSYPIDVPAGQGGLTPKLTLAYDSAAVTGNHNPQGTSGWLGEGWDLAVGSISWGEHNVTSSCSSTCGNTWEDSWQFSDAYGNGGELIPPNSNMTPWYDDTTFGLTSEPINAWHLDSSGDIRVVSYTNPGCNDPNSGTCAAWQRRFPLSSYQTLPPCFRAFLPDGTIEEFGCTLDSIQFFVNESAGANHGANYVYRWDLDAIIDASGNQIQFWYNQITNWDKVGNWKFPIDAELAGAAYDASACHNRSALCTGSSWNPAVQVLFQTAYAPARLAGAACPTWTDTTTYNTSQTMRCDDVQDLSGSGGDAAPTLQSLVVLNDVLVQVTTTPSAPSWQTLRDYQMTYEQGASTSSYNGAPVIDATTGVAESVAGYTDLTQIAEVGDDSRLSLPPLTMSYTTLDEYYVDAMNPYAAPAPAGGGNCGPAFNHTNCKLWAQSYKARYLSTLDNGEGWHEAYTWQLARNNTHGVNSGLMLENPLACTAASPSVQQTYPCDEADDENWSRVVLTQRQASVLCVAADGSGCGSAQTTTLTSTWTYAYLLTDAVAKECSDCTEDMYWGDNSDGDKLDFYDAHFMGFAAANVTNPDGSVTSETFYSTMGYGEATSSIQCKSFSGICDVDPWTDPRNALHGRLKEEDDYDTDHTTLLKQTIEQFSVMCPAPGVAASAYNTDPTQSYVGQNTSELDPYDPVAVCAVEPAQEDVYAVDGGAPLTGPHATTTDTYSYDSAGHLTQSTQNVTANDAGPGSASTILTRTQDAWNDAISTTTTSASGTYVAEVPGITTTEDGAGNVKACAYAAYDGGAAGATGQQGSLVAGLATRTDRYATSCTPGSLAGQVSGTRTYDASGNLLGVEDADALAGIGGHTDATDCTIGGTAYSACASFESLYNALPTTTYNALGQKITLNYTTDGSNANSPDASNGWGTWLTSSTDANNAVTAYGYDALGRLTKLAKPGDTLSSPTTSYQYVDTCAATGAQEPCVGLLTTQQLSSDVTVTDATYYDGWGRPVETLTPQAYENGACTYSVRYTAYDTSGRTSFTSEAYFASVTQATCTPSGYLRPAVDNNHLGTSAQYDGLGRVTLTQDALQQPTTTKYTQTRLLAGANLTDTNWYSGQLVTDANGHQVITLKDGLGRTRYTETQTGTSASGYALYGTSAQSYDWLGDVTSVTGPNPPPGAAGLSTSPQTTTSYDLLGRTTGMSDADLGTGWSDSYDPNGNLLESVDARGVAGTTFTGYDGLNRPVWRNTSNSASGAYVTYSYDSGLAGSFGTGRLTAEVFRGSGSGTGATGATAFSGAYTYTYDALGRTIRSDQTMGGAGACPNGWTCQDIGYTSPAGGQSAAGDGLWTLQASGGDVYGTSDGLHLVSQPLSGDGGISAHFDSQTATGPTPRWG